jgi:hypothetical protein
LGLFAEVVILLGAAGILRICAKMKGVMLSLLLGIVPSDYLVAPEAAPALKVRSLRHPKRPRLSARTLDSALRGTAPSIEASHVFVISSRFTHHHSSVLIEVVDGHTCG